MEKPKRAGNGVYQSMKEKIQKSGNQDRFEGTLHEVKGRIKEVAGNLSDNPKLQVEGTVEKIAGKVQSKVGQIKKVLGK
jgi:uncharacterized protein YjbJ (UPF0337 family)